MRKELPIISIALLSWSAWEMYTGNHAVAYYLLGASIYTLLVIVLAFVAGNNQCLDKLSRNSYELEAKISQISTDVAEGNHCRVELRQSSREIESRVGKMLWGLK